MMNMMKDGLAVIDVTMKRRLKGRQTFFIFSCNLRPEPEFPSPNTPKDTTLATLRRQPTDAGSKSGTA
jgi:hypothetical protein